MAETAAIGGEAKAMRVPKLGLWIAPVLVWSPGAFAANPHVGIGVRYFASPRFAIEAFGSRSIYAITPTPAGEIDTGLFGLSGRFRFFDSAARWSPSVGAGIMGAWLHRTGDARSKFVNASQESFALLAQGVGGLEFALSSQIALRSDFMIGVSIPPRSLNIQVPSSANACPGAWGVNPSQQSIAWAQPLVTGLLAIEGRFY